MKDLKVDDERAAEIAARCKDATPGLWKRGGCDSIWHHLDTSRLDRDAFVQVCGPTSQEDGKFIIGSRQDIPDLLSDRATMAGEIERLKIALKASDASRAHYAELYRKHKTLAARHWRKGRTWRPRHPDAARRACTGSGRTSGSSA